MLIVTVRTKEVVHLERDGARLGSLQVSIRKDGTVRVALDFPKDIRILRGELAARELQRAAREGEQ